MLRFISSKKMKASTTILWIVFISLITFGLVTACDERSEAAEKVETNKEIHVEEYKAVGFHSTDCIIRKFIIEGHEYLMFSSGVASSPTVVHNENCPCKKDKKDVEAN